MQQKKSINLGFRGWMLVIFQAIAFFTYQIFTNWPLNILADLYGGAQTISLLLTAGTLVGIALQLILSRFIGRVKSVKRMGIGFGIVSLLLGLAVMLIPNTQLTLWYVCYFLVNVTVTIYALFCLGILVGQWFPRRKGTVMGIATFAFPLTNGAVSVFAGRVFAHGAPDVLNAYLPFYILAVVGLLIGIIFIKDYPEQCGAWRDNDKSFTPEMAKAMMLQEIENKKTTVWTLGNTLKCRDFWLITIPMGTLLMCSVGMMTQTQSIITAHSSLDFGMVMATIMVVACFGSWLMGVLDTKFGTKRAVLLSVCFMILAGVFGAFNTTSTIVLSLICLSVFMGAGSNFTVSASAQYWRREDFPSVFAAVNPIANIFQAFGPMLITVMVVQGNIGMAFGITAAIGVVSLILISLFKPGHVREVDNRYRIAAGKQADDALAGRR